MVIATRMPPRIPPPMVAGRVGQAIAVSLGLGLGERSVTQTPPTRQRMPTLGPGLESRYGSYVLIAILQLQAG